MVNILHEINFMQRKLMLFYLLLLLVYYHLIILRYFIVFRFQGDKCLKMAEDDYPKLDTNVDTTLKDLDFDQIRQERFDRNRHFLEVFRYQIILFEKNNQVKSPNLEYANKIIHMSQSSVNKELYYTPNINTADSTLLL